MEGIEESRVTISLDRFKKLVEDQKLLNALLAAGVDNWEGWDSVVRDDNEESEIGIYGEGEVDE